MYIDRAVDIQVRGRWWFLFYEGHVCAFLKTVTSKLISFYGVNSSSDSEGEVGIEIIGFG